MAQRLDGIGAGMNAGAFTAEGSISSLAEAGTNAGAP
jgi:hypothetical protein